MHSLAMYYGVVIVIIVALSSFFLSSTLCADVTNEGWPAVTCTTVEEIKSIDWDELDKVITSSVGKREHRWASFLSATEKRKETTEPPEEYACDASAIKTFIDLYEACMDGLIGYLGNLDWNHTTVNEQTDEQKQFANLSNAKFTFFNKKLKLIKKHCFHTLEGDTKRKIQLVKSSDIDVDDKHDSELMNNLTTEMAYIYDFSLMNMTVGGKEYLNLRQEPDMADLMSEDDNEPLWRAAWYAFRNEFAPELRSHMIGYRDIVNKWAKESGHLSAPHAWTELFEVELDDYNRIISKIVHDFEDLYKKIHAYVRYKLREKYSDMIDERGLIPAHLVKNLWGQKWEHLMDLVQPYEGHRVDLEPKLKEKFGENFTKVVEMADQYYQSIGFPPLPASFYEKSIFMEKDATGGRKVDCHGTAHAMYVPRDDVRIEMCGNTDTDSLFTIHHEMGHIHYYLAYGNQTHIYYSGASPAFHEAVGDTIALLATTGLDHLIKVGLLDEPKSQEDREKMVKNQLMLSALDKIPLIFFSYIIDKWTFDFFQKKVDDDKLNRHWWDLVEKHQGLTTPDKQPRGEEYFDVAAKYHVAHERPLYTRYQIARVHQFQFLEAICANVGKSHHHLIECNIDGQPESTEKFREMLTKGSSVNWRKQLRDLTDDDVKPKVALEYYSQLEIWLNDYIQEHNVPVGWPGSGSDGEDDDDNKVDPPPLWALNRKPMEETPAY